MSSSFSSKALLPHIRDMSADMNDTHNSIFFAAVSTTRMPMIVSDPNQEDNPIVFSNPAFMKMTGYEEHELVGHNCRLLQGPETDREVIAQVAEAIKERREIAVEVLNYKKNGSSFWNALFVSPVFDQDGNLIYYFASQLDVTRRRDAEDSLRQSQKMEAVGQLTGGIAHDFNNLLTVVQGYAEILQNNLSDDKLNVPRAKRAVDAILQSTEKGATLTNQLLSFARKQKLEGRIVNLRDLTNHLIPLVEQSVGTGIVVEVVHKGSTCNSRIDPVQAEMAIINVAANARDAMNGQGRLSIVTESLTIRSNETIFGDIPHGQYTSLSISDNGSGMSSDTLSKITEPFFTTKSEGKGTGLGMSMVYGFIQQSEGVLKVESQVGEGTTVHMLFKCDNGDVELKPAKAEKFLVGRQGSKETILIVEDKQEVAEFVEYTLTEFGYTILRAEDAARALVMLEHHDDVDLMFSDISMPGDLNGAHLAKKVNELHPNVKIILTTGYADASVDLVNEQGVSFPLIRKPYRQADLINLLRQVIDGPDGIS